MDRLTGDLDRRTETETAFDAGAIPLVGGADHFIGDKAFIEDHSFVEDARARLSIPERLFHLDQLEVLYDTDAAALWSFMRPDGRPSFTPSLLADFELWQQLIGSHFGPGRIALRYLLLGSRSPGVFCFGGDLELFHSLIRERNREGLARYGYRCVEILNRNLHALNLPILTIGLVQGQALGGGFEALLSFDFLIAERGSTFGLPEVTFGLFPGMGAHALLTRKLGSALADRLILANETYTAEDMFELGVVHQLAEPGEGIRAAREFMAKSDRRHAGLVNARKASRLAAPVPMTEFRAIVDLWADAALQLREQDLKLMQRLAGAQARLARAS